MNGLNEIFAELYSEGRQPDRETVKEIITRLEARQNYIPSSDVVRREYAYLLRKEYQAYIDGLAEKSR